MKKIIAILLSFILMIGNVAAYYEPQYQIQEDETVTFIVEVEGEPALVSNQINANCDLQTVTEKILDSQASVMSAIKSEVSHEAQKGFVYTALFNGFSFDGKASQLNAIKNLDGVKNVYISRKIPVTEPMINNAGGMSYIETAYESGFNGEGQLIAVIDSYLDTGHEFFATAPNNPKYTKSDIDNILKNNELNSKTESANQVYKNEKIPYAYNYADGSADTYSKSHYHGTHVTGIAAGKNGSLYDGTSFSGIAYDSQIAFFNASNGDYLYDTFIFAAMNDAALLDADVINMSFGSEYVDSAIDDAYAVMFENAKKSGISLVVAGGNSSRGYNDITPLTTDLDYSTAGTPASFEQATAVASANNSKTITLCMNVELLDGTQLDFYNAYEDSEFARLIADNYFEYVSCGLGYAENFDGIDLTGKIALIDRGNITYAEKQQNAVAAGAAGIIIVNYEEATSYTSGLTLPSAMVTKSVGDVLKNAEQKKIKYIGEKVGSIVTSNGGKISSFSSWGVDSTLQLKPEITAPGANIYSSYPDNRYVYASGTSMAAPYITGVYAVARQFYETNPYSEQFNGFTGQQLVDLIENIAMNSADIVRYDNDLPYSPRLQGAGMIDVKNMMNSKVLLTGDCGKAKLSLGEIGNNFDVSFTITNITDSEVKFDKISLELLTDGYTEDNGNYYVDDSVAITAESVAMPSEVTIQPGEDYVFTASVTLSDDFINQNSEIFTKGFFVDGFVVLDTNDGTNRASLPFTAFYGDWYGMRIFDSTAYDEGGCTLADKDKPYNSGTYLKMYEDEENGDYRYFYYVGRNIADKSVAASKYIAFANQSDLVLAFSFKNYRAVSKMIFNIFDGEDNVVYNEEVITPYSKFYRDEYYFDKAAVAQLEDGEYTMKVDAVACGNDEVNDTLTLPLVIDNAAPQILSAQYDEDTKMLTLSASDNHYLSFIYLEYDDTYEYITVTDDDITDGIVTKTIDLSDVADVDSVTAEVCDYALNSVWMPLSALTDKIGLENAEITRLDGYTLLKLYLRNNLGYDINADVFAVFYDENGKIINVAAKKNSGVLCGTENEISYSVLANTKKAASVKVFVWENNTLMPYDTVKNLKLKILE